MTTTTMRNAYLSFSRLSLYAQCPHAYERRYLLKEKVDVELSFLTLGKTIHKANELLVKRPMDEERTGPLDLDYGYQVLQQACVDEGLRDPVLFSDAREMLRNFVHMQGDLDGRDVLCLEKEFRIPIGRFEVLGFIDRIDLVGEGEIEIIDYKSNRMLFAREEVDESVQLRLYEVAARRMWPWVKTVRHKYWMLRHNVFQCTTFTEQQLEDVKAYIEMLGEQTERAEVFLPVLNTNCVYCDYKSKCEAFQKVLKDGTRPDVTTDTSDLEAVAREREAVALQAKILYSRKEELDGILKKQLEAQDELIINGIKYRMLVTHGHSHNLASVCATLAEPLEMSPEQITSAIAEVDNKRLTALLDKQKKKLGPDKVKLLKAKLEARAEKKHSSRFWSKALKEKGE